MRRNLIILMTCVFATLAVIGCVEPGQKATPLPPTKTPKPTFTPTPNVSPTPLVLAMATKPPAAPAATASAPTPAAPSPTTAPPTAAPTAAPAAPAVPQLTTSQNVNVRSGPGTNYTRLGELGAGQTFDITGKNPAGDWYQVSYNGQAGWVRNDFVTISGDTGGVKVAENIPAPPPTPRPAPPPQPTAPPAPTAVPPPAAPRYKYSRASVVACRPQAGGTWFDGRVYLGGQPVDGERAVFSYAPEGPPVADPMIVGPHPGYPGWDHGYFSHIIGVPHPVKGDWFVWLIDDGGRRISEIVQWHSDGAVAEGTGCNDASVKFEG